MRSGEGSGDVPAVEALQDRDEGVPALRHAGRPPGPARARHEGHHVPLPDPALEEGGHRAPGALRLADGEVDVVEHHHEGAAAAAVRDHVGGDRAGAGPAPPRTPGGPRAPATASKLVRACGTPFSLTRKSSRVSPRTGCPFLSTTATSTVTSSTSVWKVGWAAGGGGACGSWGEAPRRARPRRAGMALLIRSSGYRPARGRSRRGPRPPWTRPPPRRPGRTCAPRRGGARC